MRYVGLVEGLSTSIVEPEPKEQLLLTLAEPECITVPEPDLDPDLI